MTSEIARWFAAAIAAIVLQSTIAPAVSIFGISPDLILLFLFFVSIRYGILAGIIIGFALGLWQDVSSVSPLLGQNALAKTLCGGLFGIFNDRAMRTDILVKGGLLFLGFALHDLVFNSAGFMRLGKPLAPAFLLLVIRTLPTALYTVLVAALGFFGISILQSGLRR